MYLVMSKFKVTIKKCGLFLNFSKFNLYRNVTLVILLLQEYVFENFYFTHVTFV